MSIRVLLVDDHEITRQGVRLLFEEESGIEIVAEAGDGRTAIALVSKYLPDIVVMDIGLPDLNGIEATRRIRDREPSVKVVALSSRSDQRSATDMLRAGAAGYVLKKAAACEVVEAIREVLAGRKYVSPQLMGPLITDYAQRLADGDESSRLTPREREVIQLIAEGKTIKQIAEQLNVSGKTVGNHRQSIKKKLGLNGTAELTKYAIREGITSLE